MSDLTEAQGNDGYEYPKSTSSFELSKMAKGYGWKIKIYSDDVEEMKNKTLDLDAWAEEHYGREE